ncbi:MAG: class I SAM-dependent methyltransferase, partial [Oscillospiraceae bacterium]|nr:class I SAM-dependent methyltransferase [Oscillospiraceae bacterium]
MAIFGEPESEQLSGFSISQHIIDEVLTSGGNELDSPLRIAAYFEKDHTLTENAEFLKSEYHTGGKGFIFGGNRVSIWFDDSGIRIAVGDTVLGGNATLVSWEQAATRIRELLDLGRYMPQSELDKVRGTELKAVADNLWYLRREVEDTYAFLDNELFSGGFPDDTERIAEVLTNPDNLQNIIDAIEKIAAAYEQNNDILRFQSSARLMRTALSGLSDLQRELIVFTADESVSSARPGFITQDEADAVLLRGGDIQHGKFRIYAYFLQEHTAQEKAKFLREEYGIGGFGRTGFDEWHDGQGIAYSRENNHMPYDKVILPWNKVARRIDELIADGRYLTRRELDYIPEYEKDELSRDVYSFYPRQPEELPRPFPHSTDFLDGVKIIREQLDSPERVTDILNSMAAILDNIGGESPQTKERMAEAYRNLTAFQNGTFTLFPTLAPEHRPAEKEYAQIVAPTIVAPVVVNETAEYELQLGATVYIGAEKFEIYAVDDSIVTLTDADAPLFIRDMNRSEFDRKLRENPRNDTLIKKTIAPEIDYELVERIREEMSERGFAVSDELIISGINEYSPYGDYQDISDNIENEYLSDEPQPGYEEWSEPATADNAPETPGVPSDDISAYLPNPDDVRSTVIAELNRKVDLMRNSTDYDKIRESVAYLTSWRDISNFDGVSADVLREQLAAMTDAQAVEWFSDGDWREQLDFVVISDAPAWEQTKRQPRTRTYDAFPGVPMSERNNFRITDDNLGVGVAKEKFRRNVAAIRLLKELELNNRLANSEEQDTLSKYVGWGALSAAFEPNNNSWSDKFDELQDLLSPEEFESARTTTLNAHYTSPVVIKAIYKAIENMGFKSGNILDPGCGIGNFQGLLPDSMNGSQIFGIEIDSLTGRIAQQLYQKNRVTIQGYEKTSLPDSFFDMAIGNVPFGGYGIADKKYDKYKFRIHDYFFA